VLILKSAEVERVIIEAWMWLSTEEKLRELLATELGLGWVGYKEKQKKNRIEGAVIIIAKRL
jgi:hypothetical protein